MLDKSIKQQLTFIQNSLFVDTFFDDDSSATEDKKIEHRKQNHQIKRKSIIVTNVKNDPGMFNFTL